MNNEFLKGIKAREKLHVLKHIKSNDSIQLIKKDEIIKNQKLSQDTLLFVNRELRNSLVSVKNDLSFYKRGFLFSTITTILIVIFK